MFKFLCSLILFATMWIGPVVASASTDHPQSFADDAFIDKVAVDVVPAHMVEDETDNYLTVVPTLAIITGVSTRPRILLTGLFSNGWEVGAIRSDIGSVSI